MPVINIKDAPTGWEDDPTHVYIERANVLKEYTYWLINQILNGGYTHQQVAALADKTLVCFCAPKACHGDVLLNVSKLMAAQTT